MKLIINISVKNPKYLPLTLKAKTPLRPSFKYRIGKIIAS